MITYSKIHSIAQSYTKAYNRHGKLLEEPFKRKLVDNDSYFTSLLCYIHLNPQHHQFVNDFREWEFTSWHALSGNETTFLASDSIMNWLGSKINFENTHHANMPLHAISHLFLE